MSKCETCKYSTHDSLWNEYICKKRGRILKPILLFKDCEYFKEKEEEQDEA